jgi:hypothetical protein
MGNPKASAMATSTASKVDIVRANRIEPAADFRRPLDDRKRGSGLALVVRRGSDRA